MEREVEHTRGNPYRGKKVKNLKFYAEGIPEQIPFQRDYVDGYIDVVFYSQINYCKGCVLWTRKEIPDIKRPVYYVTTWGESISELNPPFKKEIILYINCVGFSPISAKNLREKFPNATVIN